MRPWIRLAPTLVAAACGRIDFEGRDDASDDTARRPTRLSGTGDHMCIVDERGELWCWGSGSSGELGGEVVEARAPQRVDLPQAVTEVVAGEGGTCAITVDQRLYCWGLAVPTTAPDYTPREVLLPGPVAAAAVGEETRCALLVDGSLWCWGLNNCGQAGVPGLANQSAPAQVLGAGSGATQVTTHDRLGCVLIGGVPRCFGSPYSCVNPNPIPTDRPLPGGRVATQVVGGCHRHLCAVAADGSVWCLGDNMRRQLGNNLATASETWVQAAGFGPTRVAEAVSVGWISTCARTASDVWCWGANDDLACGQPATLTTVSSPTRVQFYDGMDIEAMTSGCSTTCVLVGGHVTCFGDNGQQQFADGSLVDSAVPVVARVGLDR